MTKPIETGTYVADYQALMKKSDVKMTKGVTR